MFPVRAPPRLALHCCYLGTNSRRTLNRLHPTQAHPQWLPSCTSLRIRKSHLVAAAAFEGKYLPLYDNARHFFLGDGGWSGRQAPVA